MITSPPQVGAMFIAPGVSPVKISGNAKGDCPKKPVTAIRLWRRSSLLNKPNRNVSLLRNNKIASPDKSGSQRRLPIQPL